MLKSTKQSFLSHLDEAKQAYLEQGYFIENNVFSDQECQQLILASKSLENAKNATHRPQMMAHKHNSLYLYALRHPTIVKIMHVLVGGEAKGLQTEFFYCKPGTRGFSLHQDNFFVQAPIGAFASAWIALTDTHQKKGGLIVYPGSHQAGLLPVRKISASKDAAQDPNANNEEVIVPSEYRPMNVSVPKGSVLFLHGHVVHGSNPNESDEWRYVLLNTYIRKDESFRPGNYANREIIDL
jgi:ectoine hydroxylase-related dioxygenase (phytanoyl-CoA dioxygenase family)